MLEQPRLGKRAQLARAYDDYLSNFALGDYGQVDLAPGERRGVVRRRLHTAAARRGLALRFRPGPNPALIFQVIPPQQPRQASPRLVQQRPTPRADLTPSEPVGGAAPQRPRPSQTASERYQTVLPRWMRGKKQSDRHERRKGRQR